MKDYSIPEIPNSETDTKGQEAYRTIKDWIRSVPETLEEIKKNGNEEDLQNYQRQINMVLEKLENIVKDMEENKKV